MAAAAVGERLDVDPARGLSNGAATRRLGEHGRNVLEDRSSTSWLHVLVRQFMDVMIAILAVAAVVAWLVGDVTDALTILAIVVLNGALGFFQEWKAERALESLRRMLSPRCTVVREGRERQIDAVELVPGDVVLLEAGDSVPADVRIVEGLDLTTDESALTGESVPVSKEPDPVAREAAIDERSSMAFLGTVVTNGRARSLVVATGPATELGHVATLTAAIQEETTPLQRALGRLGKRLGLVAVAVSLFVALAGWLAGHPLVEMFLTGVSLAVAVVPEGLPAVVTITLALGVRSMAKKRALVRRLQAAEALGAATVLCTDKTGTLTENQMTVRAVWLPASEVSVSGAGYALEGGFREGERMIDPASRPDLRALLHTALSCSHARIERDEGGGSRAIGDPTEAALVVAAHKAGIEMAGDPEPVAEVSFDSERKRMTIVRREPERLVAHVKGAPEVVLVRCSSWLTADHEEALDDEMRGRVERAYESLADRGLRVLAFARRELPDARVPPAAELESDLTLLGLAGMVDPPRSEVKGAVQRARDAGIRVFVVTGDAGPTAGAVAREIGLGVRETIVGKELDELDDDALRRRLREGDVLFARTTPEHKLRLVELLQRDGNVVGMTGDGVNDAPALKKADVGIAMGLRGTSVAKGASDLVLTDDNFASIVAAVEEGRRQFDNVKKFLSNLLSSNTGEVVAIAGTIIIGGPLVFLPAHLLWINLVTDGLTSLALGVEPAERDVMSRQPRSQRDAVLDRTDTLVIALQGAWIGLATLFLFRGQLAAGEPIEHARSVAFTGIVVGELVNAWNYRTLRAPLSSVGWLSNPWFIAAWIASLGLQVAAITVPFLRTAFHVVPPRADDWLWIAAAALPVFVLTEIAKRIRSRRAASSAA